MKMTKKSLALPAEWYKQQAIQLTWPKLNSDWKNHFEEVEKCFVQIAIEIAKRQSLWIVCSSKELVIKYFAAELLSKISFFEIDSNDTWARDHGGITVFKNKMPLVYDFCFNGWGLKFSAEKDNLITQKLFNQNAFSKAKLEDKSNFVLEGGSVESDGNGSLMTTENCLLSKNRNDQLSKAEIELQLKQFFGSEQVLWLKHGNLAGDDTDSHIDTLARFIPGNKIAFVQCSDPLDEHFNEFKAMKQELKNFKNTDGENYELIPLPMTTAIYDKEDGHRLPATYANFLIMNDAVLLPIYNVETDRIAIETMQRAMPDYEIVPIDCSILIRQHGSLHCVTMQYPGW